MNIIVKKFGGTSVSSISKLKKIAVNLAKEVSVRKNILVVLSAMGKSTDKLVEMSNKISKYPNPRDYDMLLSTGEQVSVSLLSMILNNLDIPAISLTGWQAGIYTDSTSMSSRIKKIDSKKLLS